MCKIGNKMRFILAVVNGELRVSGRKKADIEADLDSAGFDRLPPTRKVHYRIYIFFHKLCKQAANCS